MVVLPVRGTHMHRFASFQALPLQSRRFSLKRSVEGIAFCCAHDRKFFCQLGTLYLICPQKQISEESALGRRWGGLFPGRRPMHTWD